MTENNATPTPSIKVHFNNSLPTLSIDATMIAGRSDDVVLIRLLSMLPESVVEQARFTMRTVTLKTLIDALCAQIDHYPTKPTEPQTDKKEPAKPAS